MRALPCERDGFGRHFDRIEAEGRCGHCRFLLLVRVEPLEGMWDAFDIGDQFSHQASRHAGGKWMSTELAAPPKRSSISCGS